MTYKPGDKVWVLFGDAADDGPPGWFAGVVVGLRINGKHAVSGITPDNAYDVEVQGRPPPIGCWWAVPEWLRPRYDDGDDINTKTDWSELRDIWQPSKTPVSKSGGAKAPKAPSPLTTSGKRSRLYGEIGSMPAPSPRSKSSRNP